MRRKEETERELATDFTDYTDREKTERKIFDADYADFAEKKIHHEGTK